MKSEVTSAPKLTKSVAASPNVKFPFMRASPAVSSLPKEPVDVNEPEILPVDETSEVKVVVPKLLLLPTPITLPNEPVDVSEDETLA